MKKNILLTVIALTANIVNAQWQQTNGPFGGSVSRIAAAGNNIFVLTDNGIFLSSNNGSNWTAVNNGLQMTYILSLAANSTNVFAGTYGTGVFSSSDTGRNWTTNFLNYDDILS